MQSDNSTGASNVSKSQYCKTNHISHHSLNDGLKQLGCKVNRKEPKRVQLNPLEAITDQLASKADQPKKNKRKEIKAGSEEALSDEMYLTNRIAGLSTKSIIPN